MKMSSHVCHRAPHRLCGLPQPLQHTLHRRIMRLTTKHQA